MIIIIRTDASYTIGTGHVMRCLSLANTLSINGVSVQFVCRLHSGHLRELIEERGYRVHSLPSPNTAPGTDRKPDYSDWLGACWQDDAQETIAAIRALDAKPGWLIVDHYALSSDWEDSLRDSVNRIMVIDDLADRKHNCDFLIDQNHYEDAETRYIGMVPEHCRLFVGSRYALLRGEFRVESAKVAVRSGPVRKIMVFFGGIDNQNYTSVAIDALCRIDLCAIHVDVVVGAQHSNREEIENRCRELRFGYHVQTTRLAELMSGADLAVGAGGCATWERCCIGLPCITFVSAENQRQLVRDAAAAGMLYAPNIEPNDCDGIALHLQALIDNPALRENISRKAMAIVDGRGTDRVLRAMDVLSVSIRQADDTDSESLFEWRNNPAIRKASYSSAPLEWSAHCAWFESTISDSFRPILIGEFAGRPIGVVRFDITENNAELSIYLVSGQSNRGFGAALLAAAEQWLVKARPDVKCLCAEVLAENSISHKFFVSAGYCVSTTRYSKRLQ